MLWYRKVLVRGVCRKRRAATLCYKMQEHSLKMVMREIAHAVNQQKHL